MGGDFSRGARALVTEGIIDGKLSGKSTALPLLMLDVRTNQYT